MSIDEIYEAVVSCNASTVIANAFRIYFNLPTIWVKQKHNPYIVSIDTYSHMMECFKNIDSPMDNHHV